MGRILILDRYAPGWDGLSDEAEMNEVVDATEGWTARYDFDAHTVQYDVPAAPEMPRLTKTAAAVLKDKGHPPVIPWAILDVDNPGHAPWTPELQAQAAEGLALLPELESAGLYFTKHGYRLVWRLKSPLPYLVFEDWKRQFHAYVRAQTDNRVDPDEACVSWNHIFRLPRVRRNGVDQDLHVDFDAIAQGATLDWTAPEPLREGHAAAVFAAEDLDAPMPEDLPPKPTARDLAFLRAKPCYEPLRQGLPLAKPGSRNSTMMSTIGTILALDDHPDPHRVWRLMARSVAAQVDQGSQWTLEYFWAKCLHFAAREQANREQRRLDLRAVENLREARREDAAEDTAFEGAEHLERHLILTDPSGRWFWVFDEETRGYHGPFGNLSALLHREMEAHCPSLVELYTDKGAPVSVQKLLMSYSTGYEETQMVYGLDLARFDPNTRILSAPAAQVDPTLSPEHDQQIADWLKALAGDHHEKLLDWLACLPDTSKPLCALYLEGKHSVGKGLFAEGLSQIWNGNVVQFETVMSQYTGPMLKSPLVWANEIAYTGSVNKSASAEVRNLVGSSQFSINKKYGPVVTLVGSPRLLITANNPNALGFREALSADDTEALVVRFGHIYIGNQAQRYLENLGGRAVTERWVAGKALARHVLWLAENRTVQHGARYAVDGWARDFAEDLVVHGSTQGSVFEALVKYLESHILAKAPIRSLTKYLPEEDLLAVSTSTLLDNWKVLLGQDEKRPPRRKVQQSLKSLSRESRVVAFGNKRVRCEMIDVPRLKRYANDHLGANLDLVTKGLEKTTE